MEEVDRGCLRLTAPLVQVNGSPTNELFIYFMYVWIVALDKEIIYHSYCFSL